MKPVKKLSYFHALVLALSLVLTQTLLLIHSSAHELHNNNKTSCELCLVAGNLDSALATNTFEFLTTPIIGVISNNTYSSYLSSFKASSPLPRAPPLI